MKRRAFLDIESCSLVGVDRRFRGAYCLRHKGVESRSTPRLHDAVSQKALILDAILFCFCRFH
jgi:hypothetical protein